MLFKLSIYYLFILTFIVLIDLLIFASFNLFKYLCSCLWIDCGGGVVLEREHVLI